MPSFLFMPDSFKGTLSSAQICALLTAAAGKIFPDASCRSLPIADGGEGSVDCFLAALPGKKVSVKAVDPLGRPLTAAYGLIDAGKTAVLEAAACDGLPLVEGCRDALKASTFGVGLQIKDALDKGVQRLILGLGGSASTDGGCGAAAALGVKFFDKEGRTFVPCGGTLSQIARLDLSGLDPRVNQVSFTAMCDIDNPLCGPSGAAYVFGPQKGADAAQVRLLDAGLAHLAAVIERDAGMEIAKLPGSGAAGGMGAGCRAFFKARLQSGIDAVLDALHFEDLAAKADFIITGEGRCDSQSLQGKAVIGISRRAQPLGVPVIALVGGVVDAGLEPAFSQGLTAVFSINRLPEDFAVSKGKSAANLSASAENLFRLIKAARAGRP